MTGLFHALHYLYMAELVTYSVNFFYSVTNLKPQITLSINVLFADTIGYLKVWTSCAKVKSAAIPSN